MPKSRLLILASLLMIASSVLLMQLNGTQGQISHRQKSVQTVVNPTIVDLDKNSLSAPPSRVAAATDQDIDQDGLNDWVEVNVYGTNFEKADTDDDGYNDGVEVSKSYNPLGDGRLILSAQQKEKLRSVSVSLVQATVDKAQAQDTAIVKLTNNKDIYLRTGNTIKRIASPAVLDKINNAIGVVEIKNSLAGLTLNGVINIKDFVSLEELNIIPRPVSFLTVSLSSSTTPTSTLFDGTVYNPMLTLRLRATGETINVIGLTVQKEFVRLQTTTTSSTLPQQPVIDGVSVWDSRGVRHGAVVLPGNNGLATILFADNPIVVPITSNIETMVTIKGDVHWNTTPEPAYAVRLALNNASQVILANGRVRGSFPIRGNGFSWVDGSSTLANVTVNGLAVNGYNIQPTSTTSTPANILIGRPTQELMKFRINENSFIEDAYLTQVKVTVEGNATDIALSNWELWSADSIIATSSVVQRGIVTFNVPNYLIPYSQSRDLIVKARAVNGAGHWFRLKIADWHDILVRSATSGAFIHINASTTWQPIVSSNGYWMIGNIPSVGSLNLIGWPVGGYETAPTSSTSTDPNILINGQATTNLASFRLTEMSTYENVLVQQIRMTIQGTVNPATDLRNFELLAGSMPVTTVEQASGSVVTFNLGGGWPVLAGGQTNFSVRATAVSGTGHWFRLVINNTNDIVAYGETTGLRVYPTATSWPTASSNGYWLIGQAPDNSPVQAMISPRWGSSTWTVPGMVQFPIAAYIVTNPSPFAISVSQISLGFMNATSVTSTLVNLALFNYNGTSTSSTIISQAISQPQNLNIFTLSSPIVIAPGASWEFEARGDIPSTAPQGYAFTSYIPMGGIAASDSYNQSHNGPINQVMGHNFSVFNPPVTVSINRVVTTSTASRIILIGQSNTPVNVISFQPQNADVSLQKLTLHFDGTTPSGSASSSIGVIWRAKLLLNGTQIASTSLSNFDANGGADAVFYPSVSITNGTIANLTVNIDAMISPNNVGGTQFRVKVKSTNSTDLDIRQNGQQLPSSQIYLAADQAVSNWFLIHEARPQITNLPVTGAHIIGSTDEIARFQINNSAGHVYLRLDSLTFEVTALGLRSTSTLADIVSGFDLYDDNGTLIANPNWELSFSGTTSSVPLIGTVKFSSLGSVNNGWESNSIIGINGTRTYSLRASTTNIRLTGGAQTRSLQAIVRGQVGHLDNNYTSELNWADGDVEYSYIPVGYIYYRTGFNGSDSYPVSATTVVYQ